ncbi:MAG: hypothetical protein LC114_15720 [Bryobacterales bacterium]|nr:hypothetical protein [Bryobacterales bacterium]
MHFEPERYGASVKAILDLDGAGERLMPLARGECSSKDAARRLASGECRNDLAAGRHPEEALAGLWLYFSCLDEAHAAAQALPSREGAYWHAILHRQEPDAWNAKYWFQRVGQHSIYPELSGAAAEILKRHAIDLALPSPWDASWFVDFCDRLWQRPEDPQHQAALEIQRAEWQLLFDYCAAPAH